MKLHELSPVAGSVKESKRKGRGHGSGNGKTAGKGHKGQKARSGGGIRPGFEGGQTMLARRIPKRGFNNIFATKYAIVNVSDLDRFVDGTVVDTELLKASGIIKKELDGVKILGNGELTKNLTVKAAKFSAAAKEKIEKAAGDDVHRGRFARAVRPEKPVYLALLNGEAYVGYGGVRAVSLGQVTDRDQCPRLP